MSTPKAQSPQTHATLPRALDHRAERIDLAAAFRWFARLDMHESVANHLSMAVSDDGTSFLINPRGRHFSRICASDLLLLSSGDAIDSEAARCPGSDGLVSAREAARENSPAPAA